MRRLLKNTEFMRFNAFLTHGLDFKRINPQNASKVPTPDAKALSIKTNNSKPK